ncbi:zinc finger protein 567-like [Cylas formicarius]|uniref:zinc finger protein 567-like n=1 Tax=Cylas formicarius TaxID=197179 RepID=UPI0029583757|nr:zinc finger protein 567-like [Cylas formicarius]
MAENLFCSFKQLDICRLCANVVTTKMNIFTEDFPKMIELLTTLKVKSDDNLPQISCLNCAKDVKAAFLIRRKIIQSYRALTWENKVKLQNKIQSNSSKNIHRSLSYHYVKSNNVAPESGHLDTVIKSESHKIDSLKNVNNHVDRFETCGLNKSIVEKDQMLKLEPTTRFTQRLQILETTEKLNGLKPMDKNDQANIARWLAKKKKLKVDYKKLPCKPRDKEPKQLYCNHCKLKFGNNTSFKNHMTRHKHKKCPICEKLIRSTYLRKHLSMHTSPPVICEICGVTCKNAASLKMHNFYYHKSPAFCVCEDCGRSFRTKTKLLYHQRKDHTKERNFKCETCGKAFFLKMYLTKHINMKHMKLRPYICEYCGKGFSGKHALRTHVRQHTNETPFPCTLCGERFRQKVSLRGHMKSVHSIEEESNFFCDECGKGFATNTALDVHSRLHNEMKCPHCSDTFAEKNYLDHHIQAVHVDLNASVDESGFRWLNL